MVQKDLKIIGTLIKYEDNQGFFKESKRCEI